MESTKIPDMKNRKGSKTPTIYPERISTFVVAYVSQEIQDDPQQLQELSNKLSTENCSPSFISVSPTDSTKTFTITPTENLSRVLDVTSLSKIDIIDQNQCGDVENKTSRFTITDDKPTDKQPKIINAPKHMKIRKENKFSRKKPMKNKRLIMFKNIHYKYKRSKNSIFKRLEKHYEKTKIKSSNVEQIQQQIYADILSKVTSRSRVLKKAWAKVNSLDNSEQISSIDGISCFEHDDDSPCSPLVLTKEIKHESSSSSKNEDLNSLETTSSLSQVTLENQKPYKTEVINVALASAQGTAFSTQKIIAKQFTGGKQEESFTREKVFIQNNITSTPPFDNDIKNFKINKNESTHTNLNKNLPIDDDLTSEIPIYCTNHETLDLVVSQTSLNFHRSSIKSDCTLKINFDTMILPENVQDSLSTKDERTMAKDLGLNPMEINSLDSNTIFDNELNNFVVSKKISLPLTPKNKTDENVTQDSTFTALEIIDDQLFRGSLRNESFTSETTLIQKNITLNPSYSEDIKKITADNGTLSQTNLKENVLSGDDIMSKIIPASFSKDDTLDLVIARTSSDFLNCSINSGCTLTNLGTELAKNAQGFLFTKAKVTDNFAQKAVLLNDDNNLEYYSKEAYSSKSNAKIDNELNDTLKNITEVNDTLKNVTEVNATQDQTTGSMHNDNFNNEKNFNIDDEKLSDTNFKEKSLSDNDLLNKIDSICSNNDEILVVARTNSHSNKSSIHSDHTFTITSDTTMIPENIQGSLPTRDELSDNIAEKPPLDTYSLNSNAKFDSELNDVLITKNEIDTQNMAFSASDMISDLITGDMTNDSFDSEKTLTQNNITSNPSSDKDIKNFNMVYEKLNHTNLKVLSEKDHTNKIKPDCNNETLVVSRTSSNSNKSSIYSDCTLTINSDSAILSVNVQDNLSTRDELTNITQKTLGLNKVKNSELHPRQTYSLNSDVNFDNELSDVLITKNISLPFKPKSKIVDSVRNRNVPELRKFIKMKNMKMLQNNFCVLNDKAMRVKLREMKRKSHDDKVKNKYPIEEMWERLNIMLDLAVKRIGETLGDKIEKEIKAALEIFNPDKRQVLPIVIQQVQTTPTPVNHYQRPIPITVHKEVLVVDEHLKRDKDTYVQCDLVQGQLIDELIFELSEGAQKLIPDTEEILKTLKTAEIVKDRFVILKSPVALAKDSVLVDMEKGDTVTDSTVTAASMLSTNSSFNRLKLLYNGFKTFLRENMIVLTSVPTFFIVMFCIYGVIVIIMQSL